ncbi:MAG: ribonuclease P protein component [Spirochaetaceae bacterium]
MSESLTRNERLRRRADIRRVFEQGRSVGCRGLRLRVSENGLPYNRVLVVPPRKAGNAVRRNRLKRVGKEAYRRVKPEMKGGFDCAFVIYPGSYTFHDRIDQVRRLLRDARVLDEDLEHSWTRTP